ncbi:MAG TPA: DUF6232 family protein [Polyangiaceae bacterium]|nr:DUF6232 family protein [Polyangiaceae bacterium]
MTTDYRSPPDGAELLFEAPDVIKITSNAIVAPNVTISMEAVRSVRLSPANAHLAASWLVRAAGALYVVGWLLFYVAGLAEQGARFFEAGDWWLGIPNMIGGALVWALGTRWRRRQRPRYTVLTGGGVAGSAALLTTEDEALARDVTRAIGRALERRAPRPLASPPP